MHDTPMESDWKEFRNIVPTLRERYLEELIPELTATLQDDSQTPTERFWSTHERIQEIEKILRACLDGHSRSRMMSYIFLMIRHQMMTEDDLAEFSEDLRERVKQSSITPATG